jgi:hypothetical protein
MRIGTVARWLVFVTAASMVALFIISLVGIAAQAGWP